MWVDDKAKKDLDSMKKLKREQNQNYWWRPGQTEPQFLKKYATFLLNLCIIRR